MRVALIHIRHADHGGTEKYMNDLALFLGERGHNVDVICRRHGERPHQRVNFVTLRPISIGKAHRVWRFGKAVEKFLKKTSYHVVFGLGRTWTQDILRLGGGVHQTFCESKPVRTLNVFKRYFRDILYTKIDRMALASHRPRWIICNSKMVQSDIIARYGIPRSAIKVIYNGVDLQRFHPKVRQAEGSKLRQGLQLNRDALVLLFLGNGYRRKGLEVLLKAFPSVLRFWPKACLLVVGFDGDIDAYKTLAHKLNIARQCIFLGGRTDTEAFYGAADMYVLPTHYDPFANTTLEALACGLPVITTRHNGAHEIIRDKIEGSVVNGSEHALLQSILFWSPIERRRRATLSARLLAECHSIQSKMGQTLELIESVYDEKNNQKSAVGRSRESVS